MKISCSGPHSRSSGGLPVIIRHESTVIQGWCLVSTGPFALRTQRKLAYTGCVCTACKGNCDGTVVPVVRIIRAFNHQRTGW